MTVLEQAKALGEALAKDEVVVRLNEAKIAYEQDTELRAAMQEYNALRAALGEEFKKDIGMIAQIFSIVLEGLKETAKISE